MEIPFTEPFENFIQSIQKHGGKFLHNFPPKNILISIISYNGRCTEIELSQSEQEHIIFIEHRIK